jgi:hypothetical protein
MHKLTALFLSFFLCGYCFAQKLDNKPEHREFEVIIDLGSLGFGVSNAHGNRASFNLDAYLLNITIESTTTGLGIEFIPFNYSYSLYTEENSLSFAKLYLYWNMLGSVFGIETFSLETGSNFGSHIMAGPFFSMQTLFSDDLENWRNISYSAGIKFSLAPSFYRFSILANYFELGYNIYNDRHSIYFNASLGMLYLGASVIIGLLTYPFLSGQ